MAEKFDLAPLGDYDFYVGGEQFQVGCFAWYTDDLLDGISAATIAALTGQKSLDNIKRRYLSGTPREPNPDYDAPAKMALGTLDLHMRAAYEAMQPRQDSSLQAITFDQAMVRAFTMIENCLRLARRGYVFETALLARGCLEQICWARGASRIVDENALFAIKVQKEIGFAKSTYPTIGRLYGELSRYSHFDANLHSLFYAEQGDSVATLLTNAATKAVAMQWPFVVMDVWLVLFEEFYREAKFEKLGMARTGRLKKQRFPEKFFVDYFGRELESRRSALFASEQTRRKNA